MLNICLLVSGGLGFTILQQIHQSVHRLSAVFTNKDSETIIRYCQKAQIPIFIGNPRNGKASTFIKSIESDILLSVNYLFLIENDLIAHPKSWAINVHGSLLPKYRGRTPHVWAIINGEKQTGITAHLIDEAMDNGDVVKQLRLEIGRNDTGGKILEKFSVLYPKLIEEVLDDITNDRLVPQKQDISKATYFGKRTQADGKINWNWGRERIRNWIRAQAKPYPGAFTFCEGHKLTVHKAEFSDLGFRSSFENGTILKVTSDAVFVKTPNGCLKISEIEFEREKINLQKEKKLI